MKKTNVLARILFLFSMAIVTIALVASCTNGTENSGDESSDVESSVSTCDAHVSSDWIVDKSATCNEAGARHKECTLCGETLESEVLETLAHTEELVAGRSPTCSETGLTEGKKCAICDEVLAEQQSIEKLAHTEEIVPGKKATCTEDGLTEGKKCSVCDEAIIAQEIIPATDHLESDWIIDKIAEVGVNGSKHKECTRCGQSFDTATIPAIDEDHVHVAMEWVTAVPASCDKEGLKNHICSCGYTMESETLEKLPHTEVVLLGVASSCTSTGLTDGKQCSVCDEIIVAQSITAKKDHTEETLLGKTPTCSEWGYTEHQRCSVCSAVTVTSIPLPPHGHRFHAGACSTCGISETYGIWIVDGLGNPMTDIIVKVMKDGELVKMYSYQGEFISFDIEDGEYTLELDLSQTGISYTYDPAQCAISPDHKATTVRLFRTTSEPISVFVGAPISKDYDAYYIDKGSYSIALTPDDYTFFVFAPTSAAIYTITYECDTELVLSYHGSTFFVQGVDVSENSADISKYENGLSVNVYANNLGGDMVFAIKSDSATSCILNVEYAGDPGTRLADQPWVPYLEDENKVKEHLSVSKEGTYKVIDLTDLTISAVFNQNDGFYHLNSADGPIIFIDLTSNSPFISSIQTICSNQRMGVYVKDADGKVIEKRSYNELFIQYGMPDNAETKLDEPLRVPLTAKLAESIIEFGNKSGWWSETSEANIFTPTLLGQPYNQEYAWLLFCGYYEA